MDNKEAMAEIKERLKKLMSFSTEPVKTEPEPESELKFEVIKLKDGSEIILPEGSKVEIGIEVSKKDTEGKSIPVEDGDYELETGEVITIKGGKIEEVKAIEPAKEEMEDAPAETAPATDETPSDVEARLKTLEEQIGQILELISGMTNSQEMMMSKVSEMAEAPASTPLNFNSLKTEFNGSIEEFREIKKNLKIGKGHSSFTASREK